MSWGFMAQLLPDELLSSAIARTGAAYGLAPRQTADLLFDEMHICHPQYPKQVSKMPERLMHQKSLTELISQHTTFLLVAPFMEEHRREHLWNWMSGEPTSGRHAARIPDALFVKYRFCPECFEEQRAVYGTRAWLRIWQLPPCTLCLKHNRPLCELEEPFRDKYGVSRILNPNRVDLGTARELPADRHARLLAETARALLNARPQWQPQKLMTTLQAKLDWYDHFDRAKATTGMKEFWGDDWLSGHGINGLGDILKGAKRRSWLAHLIVLKSVAPRIELFDLIWRERRLNGINLVSENSLN